MSKQLKLLAAATLAAIPAAVSAQATGAAVPPTRAELVTSLSNRFKTVDTNGDGGITKAEIEAANVKAARDAQAGLTTRIEAEFNKLDSNKDKQLSLAEFRASAPSPRPVPAETAMQRIDGNKDQKITMQEFSGSTLAAFDQIDTNKDGTISPAERQPQAAPQGR